MQRHTSFVFVSAVRDAAVDATDGKSSAVGQLLELLVRSAIQQRQEIQAFKQEMTERYQELVSPENMPELGVLAENLTRDLRNLYEDAAVGMDWRAVDEFPVPLPMADVELSDDGFGAPVDRQGHGLQRAFIFTILQHLARSTVLAGNEVEEQVPDGEQAPVAQLILAIEEPELYQHPTKQRHLAEVLRSLSNGTLPGADAQTQILFATHSPFFVSLGHADEIRLARKIAVEECDFKICDLQSLSLDTAATRLEAAWQKEPGTFTGATLMPRLHILGAELSEGYFAQGVILVEGRSDKAALEATARILGVNFASAGIAVLSAEGKENLDRPYVVFSELGVPVYTIWDCDGHKNANNARPATNLALARLCNPAGNLEGAPTETAVNLNYAHFQDSLERTLQEEIGEADLQQHLQAACEPLELPANGETQKIPEVMFQTLSLARENGRESATLNSIVQRAWTHLTGQNL
ncbi:ATP-dependent endonuclease, OLD family protein [Aurantiacibacter atlanticus]|uniref:ATP-dependent endonuclease, OLD family protein n=1 Tax=Aurantiacibacter atlanticus TaxID=1648404 RepID=A0A0H4VH24_9SPHN|nr:AAA family ATPase [Aurantiacibacter atlanticus]AKQ42344.2 ATP-dependent endonuclease, OLD family protein [Aurantiacibacter atlanticus]